MAARVKICGITNLEDAMVAVDAGADALGFIFFRESPRFITPEAAAAIISRLPPFVHAVGVFVNESTGNIRDVVNGCGLSAVQLHGNESPEDCSELKVRVIKAFRIRDRDSLQEFARYQTSAFLLDSYVAGQLGGTGEKFNWDLALRATMAGRPIILAGGLTPENVSEALAKVHPYGVDVSSGVETSPGRKDHGKLRLFISRARRG